MIRRTNPWRGLGAARRIFTGPPHARPNPRIEAAANAPGNAQDAHVQAQYLEQLLRSGQAQAVVQRFERQPQLHGAAAAEATAALQRDPALLRPYIAALLRVGGSGGAAAQRLAAVLARCGERPSAEPAAEPGRAARPPVTPTLNTTIPPTLTPIPVVVTEAWSWAKFGRQLAGRVLLAAAAVAGLSVVLDQQGVMKGALGGSDVGPVTPDKAVRFHDVEGVDEAKAELEDVVAFLRQPEKFRRVGGKLPKGVLLYGPPGTGKTHLARAVAGEAGVPFFQMSGSEFDELYVGVGARRIRELFAAAKKRAPCIVFIDELDAVGSKRSAKDQSYMRQTLNQLLVELDGFASGEGVIFIGATNTPEALDKALVRPGRLDRIVPVPLPDVRGRRRILQVHAADVTMDPRVQLDDIARGTPGFSGADLANLVNQAALHASKCGAAAVRMADLEHAKDKILMGAERRAAVISDRSKRITAFHEGGHSLVALHTPGAMPLHKVTVIPRGSALGVTVQLPTADQDAGSHTRRELLAMLDVCMGGRVAEELVFGPDSVTTGAVNDLEKATAIARQMVLAYGMAPAVGLSSVREAELERLSPQTRAAVEREVNRLLEEAHGRARALLETHRPELDRLANALVEHESLSLDDVRAVVSGRGVLTGRAVVSGEAPAVPAWRAPAADLGA